MEARNQVEGPRIVRRRRIKGAAIPEKFHRWMELTRYPNIMQNILSRLPVYKIAQFRGVCRTWNVALSSSDFTSLLRLNSPEISWFVVNLKSAQGVDVLAAYSYSAKVWFKLPLAFLGRLGALHVSVSSNSGLVAFFKKPRCDYGRHIVVFDPRKASLVWIPAEFYRQDINLVIQPNLFCCRGKLAMCDVIRKHRKVYQDHGQEETSSQDEGEDDGKDEEKGDDDDSDDDSDDEGAWERFALVIWEREFGDGAGKWKEVARMPQEMWDEMYLNVDMDSFIRLRICGSASLVFLQLEEWKAIVCNLDTGCWECLPPLPKKIGYEDVFMLDLI